MSFAKAIKNNYFLYSLANKFCKGFLWVSIFTNILKGVTNSLLNVVLIKLIYSCFEQGLSFNTLLMYASIMIAVFILLWALNTWYDNYFTPLMKLKLYEGAYSKLFDKARNINMKYYDNPEFYDEFVWSMNEADSRIYNAIMLLGNTLSTFIYASSMIALILTIDWVVATAIVCCIILALFLSVIRVRIYFKRDNYLNPIKRKLKYFDRVMYLTDYAKEIKTTDIHLVINKHFEETMSELKKWTKYYSKRSVLIDLVMRCTTAVLFDIVLVMFLAYKVMVTKTMLLSEFAVLVNIIWQIFFALYNLVNSVTKFYENGVYSDKLKKFTELRVDKHFSGNNVIPKHFKSLKLQELNFSYNNKAVLKGINLEIKRGEKVAIVGYNGAGKTTLIKLILGLYTPTSGTIKLNGININDFSEKHYQSKFAVVFQDFQLFSTSLANNVAMGLEINLDKVQLALQKSGFIVDTEATLSKPISKEFDKEGLILSGGQRQKVAISRAFYKDSFIQVYDEPSSFLDPYIEEELNRRIIAENKDKTVIFISHRLSTVRAADKIIFINNGVIQESGSHEELMKICGGRYREMFEVQAERYL